MQEIINKIKFIYNSYKKHNTGVLDDNRTQSEKDKDYDYSEIYTFSNNQNRIFRIVNENEWNKYQVRDQGQGNSCVANTVAKMLEVKRKLNKNDSIKFSANPIYMHRINKPNAGMNGVDALKLAVKYSSCKEEDFPSERLKDSEIDNLKLPSNYEDLNNFVSASNYASIKPNFDIVGGLVNKEGSAMIFINSSYSNWCKDIPTVGGLDGGVRHSITVVDAINFNGIDYLVVEDSWGLFGKYNGQRLITREFFNEACYFAGVLLDFRYDVVNEIQAYKFTYNMKLGDTSDGVKELQKRLQSLGLFPSNIQTTGYYGNITAKAVYAYQIKYGVDIISNLDKWKGKYVGPKTINSLNNPSGVA